MTKEKYKEIYNIVHSIKRLDDILWYMNRTQKRGFLTGKKNWKFKTSYGGLTSEIELERDEFDAIKNYFETKLKSANERFENRQ